MVVLIHPFVAMIITLVPWTDVMHIKVVLIPRYLVMMAINVLMTGAVSRPDVITPYTPAMTVMSVPMMIVTLQKDANILL